MSRLPRWACEEKRRTLEDFLLLAERLRADLLRLEPPVAPGREPDVRTRLRRRKLEQSIADIDQAIERARRSLAESEEELARIEQMPGARGAREKLPGRATRPGRSAPKPR